MDGKPVFLLGTINVDFSGDVWPHIVNHWSCGIFLSLHWGYQVFLALSVAVDTIIQRIIEVLMSYRLSLWMALECSFTSTLVLTESLF